MSSTKIEWADETINPLVGCSRVSPACDHCYAIGMAHRHGGNPKLPQYHGLTRLTEHGPDWTGEVRWVSGVLEKALLRLMSVRENLRIFIGSMTDIAHEQATVQHLANVLAFAHALPQHTIMLLTKRPHILRERMEALRGPGFTDTWDAARKPLYEAFRDESRKLAKRNGTRSTPRERALLHKAEYIGMMCADPVFPLPNVWLGTTIWDQPSADRAVPILLEIPAAKRFVSVEPMLGPVKILNSLMEGRNPGQCGNCGKGHGFSRCRNYGGIQKTDEEYGCKSFKRVSFAIDWVICGGETGPGARPMHPDWPRKVRDDCVAAGVPFFFKQWGEWACFYDRDFDDPNWHNCPRCDVRTERYMNIDGGHGFHGKRVVAMHRLGKRAAGRVLDGRTWEEVPNAR